MFLGQLRLLWSNSRRRPEGGADKPVQIFLVSAVVVSLLEGTSCRPKALSRLGQEDSVTYQIMLGEDLNLEGLASLRMLET